MSGLQGTSQGQPGRWGEVAGFCSHRQLGMAKFFPARSPGARVCFPVATLRVPTLLCGPGNPPAGPVLREPCRSPGMRLASSLRPSAPGSGFPPGETSSPLSTQDPIFLMPVAEPGWDVGWDSNRAELGPVTSLALWGCCHSSPQVHPGVGSSVTLPVSSTAATNTSPHALPEHTASSPASGSRLPGHAPWPHPRLTHASMRPDPGAGIPPPSRGPYSKLLWGV